MNWRKILEASMCRAWQTLHEKVSGICSQWEFPILACRRIFWGFFSHFGLLLFLGLSKQSPSSELLYLLFPLLGTPFAPDIYMIPLQVFTQTSPSCFLPSFLAFSPQHLLLTSMLYISCLFDVSPLAVTSVQTGILSVLFPGISRG